MKWITQLSERRSAYLPFILAAIILIGYYNLIFDPFQKKIAGIRDTVSRAEQNLSDSQLRTQHLEALKLKMDELSADVFYQKSQFPRAMHVSTLLSTLGHLDYPTGTFQLISCTPLAEQTDTEQGITMSATPVQLTVVTDYFILAEFLGQIQNQKGLITLDALSIQPSLSPMIQATITVVLHSFH